MLGPSAQNECAPVQAGAAVNPDHQLKNTCNTQGRFRQYGLIAEHHIYLDAILFGIGASYTKKVVSFGVSHGPSFTAERRLVVQVPSVCFAFALRKAWTIKSLAGRQGQRMGS